MAGMRNAIVPMHWRLDYQAIQGDKERGRKREAINRKHHLEASRTERI